LNYFGYETKELCPDHTGQNYTQCASVDATELPYNLIQQSMSVDICLLVLIGGQFQVLFTKTSSLLPGYSQAFNKQRLTFKT